MGKGFLSVDNRQGVDLPLEGIVVTRGSLEATWSL